VTSGQQSNEHSLLAHQLVINVVSNTLLIGGAERQRVLLANGLAARGHRVSLTVLQATGPLASKLNAQVQLRQQRATSVGDRPHHDVIVTGVTNTEAAYGTVSELRLRFPRRRWLAVSHSWPGPYRRYGRAELGAVAALGWLGALTQSHADALAHLLWRQRRILLVSNGTDMPVSPPRAALADHVRFGYIGRLEPVKGVDRLLHALAGCDRAAGWSLDIWGEGSQRSALEAAAQAGRLPVRWHGWTGDVRAALDAIDVLLIPGRSEALPMVALEAMTRRVLVVSAAVGVMPELLQGGHAGVLLGDEESWAETLSAVLADGVDPDMLEAAAREIEARWSVRAMIDSYERAFARMLGHVG
jgi:glycosyltransferase involved in cell wall biosynthesis